MRNLFLCILSFLMLSAGASTDTTKARYTLRAYFLEDSFRLGENIHYSVTARYPVSEVAIFPDSGYNYTPFEYVKKIYFPTSTQDGYATDSVVYILAGYEIIEHPTLSIRIHFIHASDTNTILTPRDSIDLIPLIHNSAEAALKDQAILADTPSLTNYPYLIVLAIACLVVLYILYTIFGKIIVIRYRLFVLQRAHNRFIKEFDKLSDDFIDHTELRIIEQALSLWKNYLARLEAKPINTFTTTELIQLYDQETLESTLQSLDRNVYGGMVTKDTSEALQVIKRFTNRRFQIRKREIIVG